MTPEQDCLVESCLRLVSWIAHRLAPGREDVQDLVQAGNVGLLEAAMRYDRSKRTKFATYAFPWIRRAIISEMRRACPVHVPQSLPFKEVGRHTAVSIQNLEERAEREPCFRHWVQDILTDRVEDAERAASREEGARRLREKMEGLTLREKRILNLRYGDRRLSLDHVGRLVHLTGERVRQIQHGAQEKLRRALSRSDPVCAPRA